MARLREHYRSQILPKLAEQLGRDNPHSLPQLQKIVVSMGVGKAIGDRKFLEEAVGHLARITGQKPQITRARRSIANFKLREGMEIGCRVTLRGSRMYEFLDRLIAIVLPRVRDFRGLKANAFDGAGNYNLGLSEQLVFPEVDADSVKSQQGLNITLVTSARSDDEARRLLDAFGLPFQKTEARGKGAA
jgi:large subunit ribosomal protein L5